MSLVLEHKQALVAGDGLLPVKMAQHAQKNGFEVIAISLSSDNYKELKNIVLKSTHALRVKSKKLRTSYLKKKLNSLPS